VVDVARAAVFGVVAVGVRFNDDRVAAARLDEGGLVQGGRVTGIGQPQRGVSTVTAMFSSASCSCASGAEPAGEFSLARE
jgi:hypothetical protein